MTKKAPKKWPVPRSNLSGQPAFTGPLAEPIVVSVPIQMDALPLDSQSSPTSAGFPQALQKLSLLAQHYDCAPDGKTDFTRLAMAMAFDLVPGFLILNDHLSARALQLPSAYYGPSKAKGAGQLPEVFSGKVLEHVFDQFKSAAGLKSETKISEIIAGAIVPELASAKRSGDRKRAGKTLRNRLAIARKNDRIG